jgi:thioesterase domain-containing protein
LMPSLLPELKQLSAPYQLEEIARYLVNSILNYQNEGPYYLGGWSDSGVVAYETARQLMAKGHEVALLVMFDTMNPAFEHGALKELWLDSRAKKIKFHAEQLLKLKPKNVPAYVAEKMKELHRKIGRAAWQIQYKSLNRTLVDNPNQIFHLAVSCYRPTAYTGRLVFFKSAERPPGNAWDSSRGWPDLVTGEFDVYEVPGDHRSMFSEPNVETLANKLMNYFCRKGSVQQAVG